MGLWATINSCEVELSRSGSNLTCNYSIVCNGDEELEPGARVFLDRLKKAGKLVYSHVTPEVMSPPDARQLASEHADGRILVFLDNHCIVHKDFFDRIDIDFDTYDIGLLHAACEFFPADIRYYHYNLELNKTFWAQYAIPTSDYYKAYKCAASGHGAFAVSRELWEKHGGYGPAGVFVGYGGEELTTNLRYWMKGVSTWLDPTIVHAHYAGRRGYSRHYTDAYFTNMMASAYIIGGQAYLEKVCDHFVDHSRKENSTTMFDLMELAYNRSKGFAEVVKAESINGTHDSGRDAGGNAIWP